MKIDYLGHSEFLVTIKNKSGEDIKILSDSWLSDFVVGDMMARNPRIKIDYNKLQNIDAIFLSHSHLDHIDPYTLIEIFEKLEKKPDILLAETLAFLVPLFIKYLHNPNIIILKNKETIRYKGLEITGLIYKNNFLTNEDDVMTLFVANNDEIIYSDVDTEPGDNFETTEFMYNKFFEKNYKQIVYLATRNELEGNLKLVDAKNVKERQKIDSEYRAFRKEEITREYEKFNEEEINSFYSVPNLTKIFIGQGIVFPREINDEIFCLNTMKLEYVKTLEENAAKKAGYKVAFSYFKGGQSYVIENNIVKNTGDIDYLTVNEYIDVKQDLNLDFYRKIKFSPLKNEKRDIKEQKEIILDLINNRFFPYALANLEMPLKDIILESPERKYVIKVRYGTSEDYENIYYVFDFGKLKFEIENTDNDYFNEDYWANDLHDFYNGTQELYTNFLHKLDEKKGYRLWTYLGSNFLNNDILYRKYNLHFERAKNKESINEYVLSFYK
ncbi:MAG: MBL fold metallo-hydrolase [Candidatus Gracilibacteria bacterium]|nr:MBL fold metallo-hydrolase [Candidatus Gracilibacteria bacterium]